MIQLTSSQKQKIITQIKESDTFKNAPTSIALLQYLLNATSQGIHLKEGVIDIEFFGNKENTEKNSPRVRVNVYNLRKKLIQYYEQEGKQESWQVVIPKGQYQLHFIKTQTEFQRIQKKISWQQIAPYFALSITIAILIYSNIPNKEPEVWESFLSKKQSTNLFIGDLFGVTGKTITKGKGWTRDFDINTPKEFYTYIDQHPELKEAINPSTFSYTTTMAAIATQRLQHLYQTYQQQFSIHFTTKSSVSDIKEENAIYVGPIKDHNLFIPFFNEGNTYCNIKDKQLYLSNHPQLSNATFNLNSTIETEEYAIVSKYPITGGKHHFVFFSQHDIGVSATVEYFTDTKRLETFTKNYLGKHTYFTAIFRVKGQDRTSIDLKLIEVIPF